MWGQLPQEVLGIVALGNNVLRHFDVMLGYRLNRLVVAVVYYGKLLQIELILLDKDLNVLPDFVPQEASRCHSSLGQQLDQDQ
jgi:hypothetical protein